MIPLLAIESDVTLGPSPTTRWLVLIAIVATLVAAGIAARRASKAKLKTPLAGTLDARVIETNLLDDEGTEPDEPRIVTVFEIAFLGLIAGYVFFDRGFAWIHVPGTPLFVGEFVLLLGAAAMLSHRTPLLTAVRRSPPLRLLVILMGWGFVLLAYMGIGYGVDAIRDSAIWYYGAAGVLTVFLLVSNPWRIQRWMRGFSRMIPWLVGWLFISVVLDSLLGGSSPFVPDSRVSIFSHRAGNSGVIAAVIIAFVWLVDRNSKYFTPSRRIAITSAAGALLLLVALKNRGGFVAGSIGIAATLVFMYRKRSDLLITLIGVATILATVALVSQVSIALFGEREISAEQFIDNITSIVSPTAGSHRETSTTEWRIELWKAVLQDVNAQFPITGYGPGPDIGKIYNVTTNEQVPLRNPHNSHVGVIARLGWVGFGLWIMLWGLWALFTFDLRSRLAKSGRRDEAGLVVLLPISAGMMLVNAFFDPTLEGPQAGIVLWFIFGTGVALQLIYHGLPSLSARTQASDADSAFLASTLDSPSA